MTPTRLPDAAAAGLPALPRSDRAVLAGFLVLAAVVRFLPPLPPAVRYAPLVASVLVLGLPHGAVDPVVPWHAGGWSLSTASLAVGLLYLLAGGGYALAWFVAPVPSALAFLALTWIHWGAGDVAALRARTPAYPATRAHRILTGLVRGGLPMVVPLLAFPGIYREVVAAWIGLFAGGRETTLAALVAPGTRLALGAGLAALTLGSLAVGCRHWGASGAWRVDVAETVGLWAFFLAVPPVLAVGLYFCLWHSLRHVRRVLALDPDGRAAMGTHPWRAARRFAREAAPLTLAALALVAGAWLAVPSPPTTIQGLAALYLVLVAALTLPHALVVAWLDQRQAVW